MGVMREAWTDERLDDLNKRVDDGFRLAREEQRQFRLDVKAEFKALREEIDSRSDKVELRFDKVDARFEALNARFDAMQRLIIAGLLTFIFGFFVDHL